MDRGRRAHFTLSSPPSEASSRAASPAPACPLPLKNGGATLSNGYSDLKTRLRSLEDEQESKAQAKDVYDATLSWWQAGLRRKLVVTVKWESDVIAKMQEMIRTPWLDAYFVYSSTLGTHTFFMTILPALFFFGYPELGRGLLLVLGLGIYISSVIKDLFCSPRPFAPPVTRLTIGTHHLEYGFPSTHSTNSVSIALFFFAEVHRLASGSEPVISDGVYVLSCAILSFYAFSVVFGRLYTAMHSFTDVAVGVFLGAAIWWWQTSWSGIPILVSPTSMSHSVLSALSLGSIQPSGELLIHFGKGVGLGAAIERWIQTAGWEVAMILIPSCLFAVHVHPQPVDDCPCFEDAIAILSALLGALVANWTVNFARIGLPFTNKVVVTPGSGWILELGQWVQVERGLTDILIWWGLAVAKMAIGILAIFVWRLLAKSALHLILPPTFRLLARAFQLPHRRFYTPATEYKSVPSEFHSPGEGGGFGLHPIPSVIDLPSSAGVSVEVGGIGSGVESHNGRYQPFANGSAKKGDLKMRFNPSMNEKAVMSNATAHAHSAYDKERAGKEGVNGDAQHDGAAPTKHYDADVLTKVIVYAGISVIATEIMPLIFDLLGWGVRSSPPSVSL